jgi:ribose transport system ATP-binding protein
MRTPLFEARSVSKTFGVVTALSNVTVNIQAGEVHAIVGENGAGKSTLMNIFCGKLAPTGGMLFRDGREVHFHTPRDAQAAGISIAPQEISLVPHLTVAENILLGAQSLTALGTINWMHTRALAVRHLVEIDDTIDPLVPAGQLSKAQQQLVQIVRAVATTASLVIFDEPTAALTSRETDRLFAFIKSFRAAGKSIFYISHRLDEILELSQRITVLRDGHHVGELVTARTNKDEMVRLMAGRSPTATLKRATRPSGEPMLKVSNLTRTGEFTDISFELGKGEILGVAGLIGSGRTELGRCLFGVTSAQSGSVEVLGQKARIGHPADAIALGLVYLPEERKQDGIFPLLSISENMSISIYDRFRGLLGLRFNDMMREVTNQVDRLRIKIGHQTDPVTSLSGGNQQKVILGRWLLKNSRILILDEPTRGIDINAKFEIQSVLRQLADEGLSIVYISSELQEIIDVADRIVVMHEGRIKGTLPALDATQEGLLGLAMS